MNCRPCAGKSSPTPDCARLYGTVFATKSQSKGKDIRIEALGSERRFEIMAATLKWTIYLVFIVAIMVVPARGLFCALSPLPLSVLYCTCTETFGI